MISNTIPKIAVTMKEGHFVPRKFFVVPGGRSVDGNRGYYIGTAPGWNTIMMTKEEAEVLAFPLEAAKGTDGEAMVGLDGEKILNRDLVRYQGSSKPGMPEGVKLFVQGISKEDEKDEPGKPQAVPAPATKAKSGKG